MKTPLQSRARGSLERMTTAAACVLAEQGAAAFTLAEVSRIGEVSIGSIYHRFRGKEDLLRAVHRQLMAALRAEHDAIAARAERQARDLHRLLPILLGDIAELLARNAPMLRALMAVAASDPVIAEEGSDTFRHLRRIFVAAVLRYSASVTRPDPERAAAICLDVAYAAFAHELGLDAARSSGSDRDWGTLKSDLAEMCLAFLTVDHTLRPPQREAARHRSVPFRRPLS